MGPALPVLVLNQNYEPLNVCNVRRAFVLVDRGKAEIIENGRGYLHSTTLLFEIPKQTRDLTLDHVLPRHRGGGHDWENVVAACKPCNHHKAGRTPQEAHMHLHRDPYRPTYSYFRSFFPYLESQEGWRKFIPGSDGDFGFA